MLKCLKYMTPKGKKSVIGASLWLAIFQLACMLPLIIIVHVFSRMINSYQAGVEEDFNFPVYIAAGTVMILVMYFCYRKMYKMKYLSAAKENMMLRMGVADKLRRLPE